MTAIFFNFKGTDSFPRPDHRRFPIMNKKTTVSAFSKRRAAGEKLVMVTAYDAPGAAAAARAGIDILLVGDSLAMTVLGYDNTLPATMDEMIHHTRAVRRGAPEAFIVFDMPFMSYQTGMEKALENAGRAMKESGADAVKFEGGEEYAELVRRLVSAGIPVMPHIGLLPQRIQAVGGYKVTGRGGDADRLMRDAKAFEEAGAFAIVLECVSRETAKNITEALSIPTIGIGSGPECGGQVQVFHDVIGMFDGFTPKHSRRYAEAGKIITSALASYADDVRNGRFPAPENCF